MDIDWSKISVRRWLDGSIVLSVGGLIGRHVRIAPDASSKIVENAIETLIDRATDGAKMKLIRLYHESVSPTRPLGDPEISTGTKGSNHV